MTVIHRVLLIVAMVLLAIIGLTACNAGPRQYCFNEPTVGPDGRAVNHIECVSTAYPGRG